MKTCHSVSRLVRWSRIVSVPGITSQLWIILSLLALPCGSSFQHISEARLFFQEYFNKYNPRGVNIYINNKTALKPKEHHDLVTSLALSFVVQKVEVKEETEIYRAAPDVFAIAYMKIPSDLQLLKKLSDHDLFRRMNWVIIGDPRTLTLENDYNPYFPLDNKVVFAVWPDVRGTNESLSDPGRILLMETYQASKYLPYIVNSIGKWTKKGGLRIEEGDAALRRTNLTGLYFRCVTLEQLPFTYLSEGNPGKDTKLIKGYMKDVWDNLQDKFHFKYSCKKSRSRSWGGFQDGKWTGMISELIDGTADVILAPLDYTPARADVVDFLQGARFVGYRMVVRRPGLMESTWTSFTSELGTKSWIVTVCMIILVPLVLVFVSSHSPFENWAIPFQDAYLLTFGALVFQGSSISVSSTSTRLVFITIFLATFLIYAHYTSALVAQLTITSDRFTPFTNLEGLLQNGRYDLGFLAVTSIEEYFKDSCIFPFKELYHNILRSGRETLPRNHATGIQMVKNEQYVHIMEENMFHFQFYYECDLMMLPVQYFKSITGISLPKNSPYVNVFNYHLNKMRDAGLLEGMWNRWQPPTSTCQQESFVALSIDQTFTAFLALLAGAVLATFVCLPLERIWTSSPPKRDMQVSSQNSDKDQFMIAKDLFTYPFKPFEFRTYT